MLTVRKLADVSTGHITREDCDVLEANASADSTPAFPLRVTKYEYGFYIPIPSLRDMETGIESQDQVGILDTIRKDLLEAGMSEAFVTLIQQAMQEGIFVLNLDKDGEEVEELEKFDW